MDPLTAATPAGADRRGRIAFVTGKLAAPALEDVLAGVAKSGALEYEVVVLNIAVAALMTAEWAARRIQLPPGVERAVVPGHCAGNLDVLHEATGVPFERGPKDLRDLPRHLGVEGAPAREYGAHAIEILAEINHVPRLSLDETLHIARRYRADGADVIDLGCDPGGPFGGIAAVVAALKQEGFRVSVDSLDPREILPAVEAGAEIVLSVNSSNIDAVRGLSGSGCTAVILPDDPRRLDGLDETIEKLSAWGVRYRIDPVLEPIGFGFARSLGRYLLVRDRYPEAEMLLGIGNLTELTDADTAAINLLLLGFCEELSIRSVLTTEVISWASSCVRELDIARRLVHHAVSRRVLPKHLEPRLHLLRDAVVHRFGEERLAALAREIKDRNFRLFAEDGKLHVIRAGVHIDGDDPFELFARMSVEDASHAFYLGYELAKAVTALTLGKNYVQDEALRWGFLTREETTHRGAERGAAPEDSAR